MLTTIRNDDVAYDTSLSEIRAFCELCDRYGITALHAITPIGKCQPVHVAMDNAEIRRVCGDAPFSDNAEVCKYLLSRHDLIGVHGLWHTHGVSETEAAAGAVLLRRMGFEPTYYVSPFNEAPPATPLITSAGECPNLEPLMDSGTPAGSMAYIHSWRLETGWGGYSWERLERCLKRITGR